MKKEILIELISSNIQEKLNNNADKHLLETVVIPAFKFIKLKKNTVFLIQGEICKDSYFLAEGCVQIYNVDNEGNEIVTDIVLENNWFTDIFSFNNKLPSSSNFKTLENSFLLSISRDKFDYMITNIPQFGEVYRLILETFHTKSMERIQSFIGMSASDRIKWLSETNPKIFSRISSKVLSSYLGISQETLSRLRGKH